MDLALNNGFILDANGEKKALNIGIKDHKIFKISPGYLDGRETLDLQGLLITPGFIDLHIHEDKINDSGNLEIIEGRALTRMGVTSALGGNCGYNFTDIETLIEKINSRGFPYDLGLFIGYNSLREKLDINEYQEADAEQRNSLIQMMQTIFTNNKTFGVSLGIAYHPGISNKELMAIGKVAAEYDALIAVHLIGFPDRVIENLKELIAVSAETGTRLHISHIGSVASYGRMEDFLKVFDQAWQDGVRIRGDCYPYSAFCTYIGSAVFAEGFIERLDCAYGDLEILQGEYKGQCATEDIFQKLRKSKPETLVAAHVMNREEIIKAIRNDRIMVASDITMNQGEGHPRGAGTFPRLLGRYCRDEKLLDFNTGLKKITSQPADWLGLNNKGRIAEGYQADLVLLDEETVIDNATFSEPLLPPEGIEHVILNGELIVSQNKSTDLSKGKYMKYQRGDNNPARDFS